MRSILVQWSTNLCNDKYDVDGTERKNGWSVDGKWRQWGEYSYCDCVHQFHVEGGKSKFQEFSSSREYEYGV